MRDRAMNKSNEGIQWRRKLLQGIMFWLFAVILGILIPLMFSFKKEGNPAGTSFIVSLLILLGGLFLRYVILMAGQIA